MKKFTNMMLLLSVSLVFLVGCSFYVKTPIVADYKQLEKVDLSTLTKNKMDLLLGTPQSKGIHHYNDKNYDMYFYYGLMGVASSSSLAVDSGMVFATFDGEKCVQLWYMLTSKDNPIQIGEEHPTEKLFNNITVGKSSMDEFSGIMGKSPYMGRSLAFDNTIHQVAFYDASKLESDGTLKEKWILVGYDKDGIVQDLIWVSSFLDDIKALGKVESSKFKSISTPFSLSPDVQAQMLTDKKLDPTQVEALLKSAPETIADMEKFIGKPSAIGVRNVKGTEVLNMSDWSFQSLKITGSERCLKPGSDVIEAYLVLDMKRTQLFVWYDSNGKIKEYMWFKAL